MIAQATTETWFDKESMSALVAIVAAFLLMAVFGARRRNWGVAFIGAAGCAFMYAVMFNDNGPLAEMVGQ